MGSRSRARARAQASGAAVPASEPRPPRTLVAAAVVQAAEAAGVLAASLIAGIAAVRGQSYQSSSGIAITLIGFATAAGLGIAAAGLARGRSWSRTPALLTQLFAGIVGIYLLQGHRYLWGGPAVTLAVAGLAALLAPPSLRAASRAASRRRSGPP